MAEYEPPPPSGNVAPGVSGQMTPQGEPALRLAGISKSFGAVRALHNVDFEAYTGEVVGLVGDNGAGKSTLINTLLGFHKPARGTARVLGLDIRTQLDQIRSIVGFMP